MFIGDAVDVGGFLDVWPQEDANAVPADKSVKVVCFSDDGGKQTVAARLVSEGVTWLRSSDGASGCLG
jgi:hypothetical protein